jgi:hypothetical protein
MTKDEALKLAIEALDSENPDIQLRAALALRTALTQPAQEPVAWLMYKGTHKDSFWLDKGDAYNFEMTPEHRWEPLYTTPPQRPWVGLTDEEIEDCVEMGIQKTCRAIEAALRSKNT